MGYWDATNLYLQQHGRTPTCSKCGETMFPMDDHGRFSCGCNFGRGVNVVTGLPVRTPTILQVNTTGMPDKEKAKIPPINRLHSKPTAAEARYFSLMAQGPDIIGTPEYIVACEALEKERGEQAQD